MRERVKIISQSGLDILAYKTRKMKGKPFRTCTVNAKVHMAYRQLTVKGPTKALMLINLKF